MPFGIVCEETQLGLQDKYLCYIIIMSRMATLHVSLHESWEFWGFVKGSLKYHFCLFCIESFNLLVLYGQWSHMAYSFFYFSCSFLSELLSGWQNKLKRKKKRWDASRRGWCGWGRGPSTLLTIGRTQHRYRPMQNRLEMHYSKVHMYGQGLKWKTELCMTCATCHKIIISQILKGKRKYMYHKTGRDVEKR